MSHWRGLLRWVPEALGPNQKPRFCPPGALEEARSKSPVRVAGRRDLYYQNNNVRIIADSRVRKKKSNTKDPSEMRPGFSLPFWSAVVWRHRLVVPCFNRRLQLSSNESGLVWRTEREQEHQTVAPSLELEHFVIRRLYAQMVGSLSAWHPRRACLIQSTMPMRVCEIGNHLNLPAPDGPVSSSSFVCQITCL
jgi:hypothetical protein